MNIYDFEVTNNQGQKVSLKDYQGKLIMIVNTATKCGLTPQYEGLEKLYQKYKDEGLEILDFPCNQFMNQAPGTDEEIESFCSLNYHTTFPRFKKINVNGSHADPLYKYLKEVKPKDDYPSEKGLLSKLMKSSTIKWNFAKFLVDRNGNVIYRFSPTYLPEDMDQIIKEVI